MSGKDLITTALLNRAFHSGVLPMLYRMIVYTRAQHDIIRRIANSAFMTILAYPNLAIYVHHIDLRYVPPEMPNDTNQVLHSSNLSPLDEIRTAIGLCKNLRSFVCTSYSSWPFVDTLGTLNNLEYLGLRLSDDLVEGLETDALQTLLRIRCTRRLDLDHVSQSISNLLPSWISSFGATLRTLTLYSVKMPSAKILQAVLENSPQITALHVVSCHNCLYNDVLNLIKYTPTLESLSFTCQGEVHTTTYDVPSTLRHLAIDLRPTFSNDSPEPFLPLITTWKCSLSSLSIRIFPEKTSLGKGLVPLILAHKSTLSYLSVPGSELDGRDIRSIMKECTHLESLALALKSLPVSVPMLAANISRSTSLRMLIIDRFEGALPQTMAETLLISLPSLREIATESEIWRVVGEESYHKTRANLVSEQKRSGHYPLRRVAYWFIPPHHHRPIPCATSYDKYVHRSLQLYTTDH
ncbi:hypothetical protein QCA50_013089 [Cerrena zonata]|uniref:F-box domain-containing protein n=1 Tax=Cerrena zonata TaxID=2478898 RepID=A0AAW0FRN5_9APHY